MDLMFILNISTSILKEKKKFCAFGIWYFYSQWNGAASEELVAREGKMILQLLSFPLLSEGTSFT